MSHSNGHIAEIGTPPPMGRAPVTQVAADGIVHAPPEAVFAFLSDLDNHWLIADRFVDVLGLGGRPRDRNGGWVRLRGPLGLRRTASTRVLAAEPPRLMAGVAEIDTSTRARIEWRLRAHDHGTAVRLTTKIDAAGPLDRVLLALGGRWWLRRRFAGALARLAGRFEGRRSADMPPLGRLLMGLLSLRWGLKGGRA